MCLRGSLRTSGLNFLTEAYEFLDAIHAREYYPRNRSDIADGQDFVVVKQLRFYLRLIIVCLLMGKAEEAWNHLDTLGSLIDTHTSELEVRCKPDETPTSIWLEALRTGPVQLLGVLAGVERRLRI